MSGTGTPCASYPRTPFDEPLICHDPPACSCTRPRFPAAVSGRRPTPSSTGSPPRASPGGRCCRSGRPTATARPTRRRRPSRPGRGCWPSPRARVTAEERERVPRRKARLDRRLGALRPGARRDRRPGALRPRVGRAAPLRRRARRAADRRRPDLRGAGLGRPRARIPSCSATTPSPACRRTRSPTRASCGATRCTTGRRCGARGYAWWIGALPPHVRALRPRPHRPLPRLRRLLGGAARRARRARRALAARPGPRRRSTPPARRSAELPLIAEDLGVITPAVDAAARRARAPRHGRAAVRLRRRRRTARTCRRTTPRTASSTRARTTTTRSAAGRTALGRAAARAVDADRGRRAERRAPVVADRARLRAPGAGWRWCRPRTCSGSARRRG